MSRQVSNQNERKAAIARRVAHIGLQHDALEAGRFAELYKTLKVEVLDFRNDWHNRLRRQALTRTPERRPVAARSS